jgi:predicted transcriptional regulator
MTAIKTAISIDEQLFEGIEALASEMQVSRSHVFALAVEEYLQRHQNQRLLQAINEAHADGPDEAEIALRRQARRAQRQLVEGEW